jgi:hypothetical protein
MLIDGFVIYPRALVVDGEAVVDAIGFTAVATLKNTGLEGRATPLALGKIFKNIGFRCGVLVDTSWFFVRLGRLGAAVWIIDNVEVTQIRAVRVRPAEIHAFVILGESVGRTVFAIAVRTGVRTPRLVTAICTLLHTVRIVKEC